MMNNKDFLARQDCPPEAITITTPNGQIYDMGNPAHRIALAHRTAPPTLHKSATIPLTNITDDTNWDNDEQ